jgi:hypothetical protein
MTMPSNVSPTDLDAALAADDVLLPGDDPVETTGPAETADASAVAVPDGPMPWEHQKIDFHGDVLEYRRPTQQALAAFALSSGKYIPQTQQNNFVGLFIRNHLSETSFARVFERLLDPDDAEYTMEVIGDLMRVISTSAAAPA